MHRTVLLSVAVWPVAVSKCAKMSPRSGCRISNAPTEAVLALIMQAPLGSRALGSAWPTKAGAPVQIAGAPRAIRHFSISGESE